MNSANPNQTSLPSEAAADKTQGSNSELFLIQKFLSPEQIASSYPISRKTVYDWHFRPSKYGVPLDMFVKFGRKLLVRRDVFEKWVISRGA